MATSMEAQPTRDRSWSSCLSWSSSDWSSCRSWSSSDWGPCLSWSSSDWSSCESWSDSSEQKHNDEWEIDSANSHPGHPEADSDYEPEFGDPPARQIAGEANCQVENQETHNLAWHLKNPMYWVPAYAEVETLKPGNIISVAVLDFFLTCESFLSQNSGESVKRFYYLAQDAVGKLTGDPKEDLSVLRHSLRITAENVEPAPFLILITSGHSTYFLVMFDFLQAKVLILGRRGLDGQDFYRTHAEWGSWNGPTLWRKIYNAVNWPESKELESRPTVYETDFVSRDSHSGPGIVGFVQLLHGFKWKWDEFLSSGAIPEVPCDHQAREQAFYTVLQQSYECFTAWNATSRTTDGWTQPPKPLLDEMNCHPARLQWVRNLNLIFQSQSSKCKRCSVWWQGLDDSSSEDIPLWVQNTRAASPSIPRRRPSNLPDPLPLAMAAADQPALDEGYTNGTDFANFDDYGSAPFSRKNTPPVLNAWTFDCSGFLALPNWASTWRDQGYRLPPDFDRVSSKQHPTDYISRLFPVVEENAEESEMPVLSETSSLSLYMAHGMNTDLDGGSKPISMGASSMLDEAGRAPKTRESYDVFVRGKTRAGDFINLDLEKDHVPLAGEQIATSVDIDSILWVTRGREFSCRGAINLRLKSHFTNQPPFSANPSIYITLFEPPEDEAEFKRPQLRRKTRFPLSSVPHMTFGHFGEATQQFNLYVFFPRMLHKNNSNNRAVTIIPQELQELWLSEVLKALESSMGPYPGTSEYLPHSAEQLGWKTGNNTRQPTWPVSPSTIGSLLANIRQQVLANEDLLSRFGSFFFVLDARGIKLLSKQHMAGENSFQALQRLVPSLDWDYMLDRTKGELYLDLGVSFHPINTAEPMVGLWRLCSLRPSYALMGYSKKKCKEYSHNTLRDYGGMKAETSDFTKHHTHIVKRISYNLHFEAVRQPGEKAYISKLDDAIRCNQRYVDGYERWVKVLEGAEKHAFGVRDELRASAYVVNELIPVVMERAERFLKCDPIIWIPAKTFFRFASRRMVELHGLHCKLALIRPGNFGTLSALILHLMRSVMVTPSSVPAYVQDTLRTLHLRRVAERFGMFFVDDLDPNDMERINVNLGEDGGHILRDHKAAFAAVVAPKKTQSRGIQLVERYRTLDCPWGETISWATLQRLCKEHPVDFLRRFEFLPLDIDALHMDLVEPLFTAFTREAWLGLQESFLPAGIRPLPNNLKDSMEVWACQNIQALLGMRCTFLPSTYGLEGASTSRGSDISFKALRTLFFPPQGQRCMPNTIWEVYSEKTGYIGKYWELLETYENDPQMVLALNHGMDQIFEQLQCLPQSKAGSNLWHATHGSICFVANPQYYRIKTISADARQSQLGPQRPQVALAQLRKRLNPYDSVSKKRKRRSNRGQSFKTKNSREPPKKRQKTDQPIRGQARLSGKRVRFGSEVAKSSKKTDSETGNLSYDSGDNGWPGASSSSESSYSSAF